MSIYKSKHLRPLWVACALQGFATWTPAQNQTSALPDPAAELRRLDERVQAQRQREEKGVDVTSPAAITSTARIPVGESPCFPIHHLQLIQDGSLAPTAMRPMWEPNFTWALRAIAGPTGDDSPMGKCLGAQGVALVIQRAQDSVLARGYVTTRVLAAAQDLSQSTLTLTLVPGRVRDIRFKTASTGTVTTVPIGQGDVLNLRDVEQALENLKRVPTVEADIQIEPALDASAINQSDLVIAYTQKAPMRFSISADDSGSKGTGKYQGSATLSLDNPLGLSDLFYFTASHDLAGVDGGDAGAHGTRASTVHYSLPLGYWLLGGTYSSSRYFQSVAGLNQSYVYSGTSENGELKLSRIVYRDTSAKTSLGLKAWQRRSNNFIDDTEVLVHLCLPGHQRHQLCRTNRIHPQRRPDRAEQRGGSGQR